MSGIYLHIPFCKQACSYCDFYFVTRQQLKEQFVESLLDEINQYRDTAYAKKPIKTIYFGGGTPSLLSPRQLEDIFTALRSVFQIKAKEITLEMNPDDVTAQYLAELKSIGINRASMGVQSFQPALLSFMNRAHTRQEALQSLELLSASGFQSFTVDLIYGNPGQTMQQLTNDLDLLLKFDPPHVSAYSLTVEPRTRLGKQVELGRIQPPKDDHVADQFEMINDRLSAHGIRRYEVSNYSTPGAEAVHNSSYWNHKNYIGLGPGAHSFWWDENPRRWQNESDLKAYCSDTSQKESEQLSMHEMAEERIMMGLRTRVGISGNKMAKKYQYSFSDAQEEYLQKQKKNALISFTQAGFALTDSGIGIADSIILDFITLH